MTPDAVASPWEFVHGTAIVVRERAVLLRGPSGLGKSRLAERLLAEAGRRRWFARLVGDDRVGLARRSGRVLVRGHAAVAGLIERRTQGLVPVPFEPVAVLQLAVDLAAPDSLPRHPEAGPREASLLGIAIPCLVVEVEPAERACCMILDAMRKGH